MSRKLRPCFKCGELCFGYLCMFCAMQNSGGKISKTKATKRYNRTLFGTG